MQFDTLIVAYNNPRVLRTTLASLLSKYIFIDPNTVTVFDNCSSSTSSFEILGICKNFCVNFYRSDVNLGWGGSINHYLQCRNVSLKGDDKYLLVMAHDALFIRLNLESIAQFFTADSRTLFVSPSYLSPRINSYNIFKSYFSKPGASFGRVIIAQQTAFFANQKLLSMLRYDEEFWIYGCEYEIQLRANDLGLRIYQVEDSIIINPESDTPSDTANIIYTLNSLYLAYKRNGFFGMICRSLVVSFTLFRSLFFNQKKALDLFWVFIYCFTNPGMGFKSYKKNDFSFTQFPISSLSSFQDIK